MAAHEADLMPTALPSSTLQPPQTFRLIAFKAKMKVFFTCKNVKVGTSIRRSGGQWMSTMQERQSAFASVTGAPGQPHPWSLPLGNPKF